MLKNEIIDGELHYTPKTVYADAMYAHALVRAMEWLESEYHIIHEFKVGTTMLRTKAAEIMRGFGYTEEDDGSG